jgi:hypothetical protein
MDNKKPMVWFDVDDVIVETSALMEKTLRRMTGKTILSQSWPHHGFAEIYGFKPGDMERLREMWMHDQLLERAPLREGVAEAMVSIRQSGYELGLITARGWHPQGEALTWAMAAKHGLPIGEVVVLSYEECKAKKLEDLGVRVDGFVDDTHRHVRACQAKGWSASLMTQPWNEKHEDVPRVSALGEFAQMLAIKAGAVEPARRLKMS